MLTTCKYNDYSLDSNANLLFCCILTCVFVVIQQVFLLIYILRFCGVAILTISINLQCMYKKSVLWRYNDAIFPIYGV